MSSIIKKYEEAQVDALSKDKEIPEFQAGDTVRVNVRIVEGSTERVQAFEGVCIARKNRGINSSFVVRKVSHGEGVERIFPLYSPRIDSIQLVRRGDVRRAKLYYMRELSGKAARIKEKMDFGKSAKGKVAKLEPKKAEKPSKKDAKTEDVKEEGKQASAS